MSTDLSEKGLEALIVDYLTSPVGGWVEGSPKDYEREYAVDLVQLRNFLWATQPDTAGELDLDVNSPMRRKFLARLQGEITKRGVVDVLRNGLRHGPHDLDLFYGTPSPGNVAAQERYKENRFSVTRQLRYSRDETQLALDLGLFINGVPVATFELKNSLTKQTAEDAVEQYQRDRDPRELLFQFGRCMVHFAVDDQVVRFCTELRGKASWFLPFDQGFNDGAGNPPNPDGLKTDYLWKRILTRDSLTNILEKYAQIVLEKDRSGKKTRKQIFPRYHQLDVVRKLLADGAARGAGHRYLIEHSAGSGKSNSIAWLAHQLIGLHRRGKPVFESILVVTDRVVLDDQIAQTIRQFVQVGSTVTHADSAAELRKAIEDGKKIIITTVQKFPFIYAEIGNSHRDRAFAIVIDEAHSSQGGQASRRMNEALGMRDEDDTPEDVINRTMAARKMLSNANYYAFTATPKNKTLETFGEPYQDEGRTKHKPFHSYTMKQAIQEGFILDVLASYTPVQSYYKLVKTVEGDPEFDARKANKKLRRYVEDNQHAIRLKAEIMVDHFLDNVLAVNKIGGKARAMVVTSSIQRAIDYHFAIQTYLAERKSPYRDIVAFSGEPEYRGEKVTEAKLNGFPTRSIPDRVRKDPYRFLVCADKFQTGYDEPLLHTMYVDKPLSGIKAVQTLSRLNRAHPQKHDVFVLDFANDSAVIQHAFADYYRTTILSDETDPNKLNDLESGLDIYQVYDQQQVDDFVTLYLGDAPREQLDPILDACAGTYTEQLDEDGQIDFKGKAKAFARTYSYLAAIVPYSNARWEKLSIFLNFLIPKLPAPAEEDGARGILETVDIDSYRVEKQKTEKIILDDEITEIDPAPGTGGGHKPEHEPDLLSNIVKTFNEQWGNISWTDTDRVQRLISADIPARVAADGAYQNAMNNNDRQNARIEHDAALARVMTGVLKDDTQLFKQFSDNESFKKWLSDSIFAATYEKPTRQLQTGQHYKTGPPWSQVPILPADDADSALLVQDPGVLAEAAQRQPSFAVPARFVNAFIAQTGQDDPVEPEPLALDVRYDVVCNVGVSDVRNLLRSEDARFPSEFLPAGPLELRAVLFVEGSRAPVQRTFELPADGGPSEWVRLPLPIADKVGTIHGELGIYYEVAVVHIQALEVPVGGGPDRGGPSAHLLYRLTRSFSDLGKLSGRQASMVVTDRPTSPAVLVNGLAFAPNEFAADHNAADTAVRAAREQMYSVHFRVRDGKDVSRFATTATKRRRLHSKPESEFVQDLRVLANCGRRVFSSLFRDNLVADTIAQLVRGEAEGYDRSPVIQVIDLASRSVPIPWALVYDLPLGGTPALYEPCPSISEFGPGNDTLKPVPARCPYEAHHRAGNRWKPDQLCPWGFWGLSSVIEHPPYVSGRDLETVVGSGDHPLSFLLAEDTTLDHNLRRQHISALKSELSTALTLPSITSRDELARQLADETMDVVYLYCHCGYDRAAPSFGFDPSLWLGSFQVTPLDVDQWASTATWPDPHWPTRHPLVVVNGCHTAELVTGSLTSFVDAFTNRAAAAGLIGTEITIDQGVAGWAMELFLMELYRGKAVGEALRSMRWAMFDRGNVMGLAYTPHCLAGLALRPPEEIDQETALIWVS